MVVVCTRLLDAPNIQKLRVRMLWGDDFALGSGLIEFTKEIVATCFQRADENHRTAIAGNVFFAVEFVALEFFGCGIGVGDFQFYLGAHRNRDGSGG